MASSSFRYNRRFFVPVVIIAGLATAAVIAWASYPPNKPQGTSGTRQEPASAKEQEPWHLLAETEQSYQDVSQRASEVSSKLDQLNLTPSEAKALGDLAGKAFVTYASGTPDDFARLRQEQGFDGKGVAEAVSQFWAFMTKPVATAHFQISQLRAIPRFHDGLPLEKSMGVVGSSTKSFEVTDPRGDYDVPDPAAAAADVVEIAIPGDFIHPVSKEPFVGELRLVLANKKGKPWVIIRSAIYRQSGTTTGLSSPPV